jgi:hypothetical protein
MLAFLIAANVAICWRGLVVRRQKRARQAQQPRFAFPPVPRPVKRPVAAPAPRRVRWMTLDR